MCCVRVRKNANDWPVYLPNFPGESLVWSQDGKTPLGLRIRGRAQFDASTGRKEGSVGWLIA